MIWAVRRTRSLGVDLGTVLLAPSLLLVCGRHSGLLGPRLDSVCLWPGHRLDSVPSCSDACPAQGSEARGPGLRGGGLGWTLHGMLVPKHQDHPPSEPQPEPLARAVWAAAGLCIFVPAFLPQGLCDVGSVDCRGGGHFSFSMGMKRLSVNSQTLGSGGGGSVLPCPPDPPQVRCLHQDSWRVLGRPWGCWAG